MAGTKPIKLDRTCENCSTQGLSHNLYMITFKGNHGEVYTLETHCNGCGYSEDGEGNLRNRGRIFPSVECESVGVERSG